MYLANNDKIGHAIHSENGLNMFSQEELTEK